VTPEVRALAGLWTWAIDLALAGLAALTLIHLWAPPQDLPWKPLRLSDPVGLATAVKFQRAAADPLICRRILSEGGISLVEEPDRARGGCETTNFVRFTQGALALSPAAPVMTCPVALGYAFWSRHVVQPAARAELSSPIARIEHYGSFACRNVYGRAEGRRSEHATANALDVAAFRTEAGREISVARDFRREDGRGRFLRRVRDGACPWFRAVLTPDYNAAHADHVHLDAGRYGVCR
jgi:hypothetical protein